MLVNALGLPAFSSPQQELLGAPLRVPASRHTHSIILITFRSGSGILFQPIPCPQIRSFGIQNSRLAQSRLERERLPQRTQSCPGSWSRQGRGNSFSTGSLGLCGPPRLGGQQPAEQKKAGSAPGHTCSPGVSVTDWRAGAQDRWAEELSGTPACSSLLLETAAFPRHKCSSMAFGIQAERQEKAFRKADERPALGCSCPPTFRGSLRAHPAVRGTAPESGSASSRRGRVCSLVSQQPSYLPSQDCVAGATGIKQEPSGQRPVHQCPSEPCKFLWGSGLQPLPGH
ncbi:hypothetical protein H920_13665 [Fukomys damarensis]|uniref:Uncharacterized protein n=1 Tax=Fukomys damarensis TaxID=885580 RepID=A0A091CYH1_FUKDA|nr:hypothetical protein H920_13665 [Fukomys damarensis]